MYEGRTQSSIYSLSIRTSKHSATSIEVGADIDLCPKNGASPLIIACKNGHDSIVQLLLSNGANINLCTEDGKSPLFTACVSKHESTVQF